MTGKTIWHKPCKFTLQIDTCTKIKTYEFVCSPLLTTKLRSNHDMSKMDIENWIQKSNSFFFGMQRARARSNGQINSIRGTSTCLPGTRKLCRFFYIFPNVLFARCRKGIVLADNGDIFLKSSFYSFPCVTCSFVSIRMIRSMTGFGCLLLFVDTVRRRRR